jgi:hypothetical protein
VKDPSGVDVPGKQCIAGWPDVRSYLRDTHISPSMKRVTESTSFELIANEDKGKTAATYSGESFAAETRQTIDVNAGEGASGSKVGSQGRELRTDSREESVGVSEASAEQQQKSRERPLGWNEILN